MVTIGIDSHKRTHRLPPGPPAAYCNESALQTTNHSACATPAATQFGRPLAGGAYGSGTAGPLNWTGAAQAVWGGDGNHLAKVRVAGSNPVVRSKKVQVRALRRG